MHIEPGVVTGAKLLLSYATAAAAGGATVALAMTHIRRDGVASLAARGALCTALVFAFFEVLPHWPVGVSEVHLILGSTLFLVFGVAPAAIGLAFGLLAQGLLFAPFDLPQYGMNATTLIAPLLAVRMLAARVVRPVPYVDLTYREVFALSLAYQGGVVVWVAFWALYGHGVAAANLAAIGSFGAAYLVVVAVEPLVDLGVLGAAKALHGAGGVLVERRMFFAAAR